MDRQVIVRLSFPRGSGISVTAVSRTPSTEEPPMEITGHTEPGGGAPIIEHNDIVEVDLTDGGGPASEAPEIIIFTFIIFIFVLCFMLRASSFSYCML